MKSAKQNTTSEEYIRGQKGDVLMGVGHSDRMKPPHERGKVLTSSYGSNKVGGD